MNISLVFQHKFRWAVRTVLDSLGSHSRFSAAGGASLYDAQALVSRPLATATRRKASTCTHQEIVHKPLRVVRVFESGQARSSVGRMVISGRMADVCAELDRLVAHEATLH